MSDLEHWELRFAGDSYRFGTEPNAFLVRQAHRFVPGQSVLSIADGEGRNGVWLAGQGLAVTSQDFSPTAQAKARALATGRNVSLNFELSDLTQRNWEPDSFDAIVGIFFQFLSPSQRQKVFADICRAVRPGGLVIIEGYGPKQLDYGTGGPGILENLYTEAMLREAFADLSEIDVTSYDAVVSEGEGHRGMSALVDLVARR